jgi:dihydroflavonol-4-reductase
VAEAILRALEKEGNLGEKYLIGKHTLTMGEFARMVCEISSAPLPKRRLPSPAVMAGAALMTKVADLSGRPPLLGMSTDQMRNVKEGAVFDGSKAERELGITYTGIQGDLGGSSTSGSATTTLVLTPRPVRRVEITSRSGGAVRPVAASIAAPATSLRPETTW